ncbi:uncharacterized protein SETTUDRAFT_93687 [Exserohilum turcica Et28A]|uniref:Uncharacterized protein n=1 Tax=Exserohilum turcicum (strain 28A) TaxID=671987 RepID=R0IFR6_EXST2|nr:uncharacterized protein SETTUDRAFT_93687 [Exserohilum turcica Et28A]EOA84080.1 hypothetical protein SETTUDRAFT_93687 [Exserohilum turcica Et28A]
MASNNDDSRRDNRRPEDNPFIAFRRFADSQVSSLLNTVFTLPATLANYNNAHQARERCLFGKADQRQCDRLHGIEAEIAELRNEGRELFRVGDVQAVLRNSEELMKLDRKADDIRREILHDSDGETQKDMARGSDTELVERVANKKGQEWGWSWDWGFPRPFDHERRNARETSEEQDADVFAALERLLRLQAEASRLAQDFEDKAWNDSATKVPRIWSWSKSWQWPPQADASQPDNDPYSPRALEQNHALDKAGVPWRVAYEDLLRIKQNERPHDAASEERTEWANGKIPVTQRQSQEEMERGNESSYPRLAAQDEPSYEYSHDHEDQHDDPPTPKRAQFPFNAFRRDASSQPPRAAAEYGDYLKEWQEAATEMDAYEHLDATSANTAVSSSSRTDKTNEANPSILSTLTTTERTVAPDGSITTKVMLKKRFADGREESSETVHTQRGQETDAPARDPWKALQNAQSSSSSEGEANKKKNGWFWSS